MTRLIFAFAVIAASAANANTDDVDLGIARNKPIGFSGTPFPDRNRIASNVGVRAPVELEAFTAASMRELGKGREAVTLFDYGGHPGASSPGVSLSFEGPKQPDREPNGRGVSSGTDGDSSQPFGCARDRSKLDTQCSVAGTYSGVPAAAPEIDTSFAAEGMLLLAGGLIVLRARRTSNARAIG
jgi:hypothetical protein